MVGKRTTNRFYPASGGNHRAVVGKHRRSVFTKDISAIRDGRLTYLAIGHRSLQMTP